MTERKALLTILITFFLLSAAYSVVNPLHEATDELRHYRFVRHIVQRRSLPVQGAAGCSAQGHHPPLFYSLAAIATFSIDTGRDVCYQPPTNPFWAYRNWEVGVDNKNQYLHSNDEAFPWRGEALAAHIARLVNVVIGTAVIYITWLIGHTVWPNKPWLALGGAAFIAFNPMFLFMTGAINNDVIAALAGASVTLGCVKLLRDKNGLSPRWGIILGTLFGLALMSKFNLAAIALSIETAVSIVAYRKKQWRNWWIVNILISVFTLLVAGWWFVRNQFLYGEPTGFQRLTELWGVRNPADSWGVAVFELPYAWTSLWGRFGYGQIPLPQIIYTVLGWIVVLGLVGLAVPLLRRQRDELNRVGPSLLILILNVILFFGVLFNYLLVSPAGPMGRFFFPALPSLAILTFYGLSQFVQPWGKRPSFALATATNVGMVALSLVALFGYLAPAYAQPEGFVVGETAVPNPTDAQFDSLIKLHGYEIHSDDVHPGEPLDIDLYWEVVGQPPGNFLFFVHLIDSVDTIVAQRDTHPGLGNYPSSQWQVGDQFIERIRLFLPETAYTDETATLSIGFYAPVEGYRLGITDASGNGLGDALTLGQVNVAQSLESNLQPPPTNPLAQNFNNELLLVGYDYSQRLLQADNQLTLTLYWQALPDLTHDYMVEVQLFDAAGNEQLRQQNRPQQGSLTTTTLTNNQLFEDHHTLSLENIPPGIYSIHVALIDTVSKRRQNIVGKDGHWINNHLVLASVRVAAQ
ncbi:MAG: hypothetical protein AAF614_39070 [Chloroflexota bacterium]